MGLDVLIFGCFVVLCGVVCIRYANIPPRPPRKVVDKKCPSSAQQPQGGIPFPFPILVGALPSTSVASYLTLTRMLHRTNLGGQQANLGNSANNLTQTYGCVSCQYII